MPSHDLMFELRTRPWYVDDKKVKELKDYYNKKLKEVEKVIANNKFVLEHCNGDLNPASPKQMQMLIYEKMNIPIVSKTKTNKPSTDKEALTKIHNKFKNSKLSTKDAKEKFELFDALLKWRVYKKQVSTYLDGLDKHIVNGQIFTEYLIHGTETARLSSRKPNMQNIPSEFDDIPKDKKIKSIFVAPPGYKIVCADYSQIELRNLGNTTCDTALIDAFNSGVDLHLQTASNIFGKPIEQVKPGERKMGKTANFGIVYGAGKYRLANEIDEKAGLSDEEVFSAAKNLGVYNSNKNRNETLIDIAESIREIIYNSWPEVRQWQKTTISDTKRQGYVYTPFGRVRYLPLPVRPSDGQKIHQANQAINTPIQSVSSDCLLLAMISLNNKLKGMKSYIVGQVHDSIILYVHNDEYSKVLHEVKTTMEQEPKKFMPKFFKIPMIADIESGEVWSSLEPVKI
jgi:DNA polymerase-1